MNASSLNADLLLGCGGRRPGIRLISTPPNRETGGTLLAMPASVYGIDVDPVRSLVACGTRAGTIHLLRFASDTEHEPPAEIACLLHGRPVLSVCFTTEGGLASADDTGQVLFWRKVQESVPERCLADGPMICSLYAEAERTIVGLGAAGQVAVWNTETGQSIAPLAGLPAVVPICLARLTGWTLDEQRVAVYPAQDGQLVVIQTDPPLIRVCRAHEGRWYAAFQIEDQLVTVGYDDGIAKLWRWSSDGPVCDAQIIAFPGIIDAAWMPQADVPRGVAVFDRGNAIAFTMTPQGLGLDCAIPGDAYRVVAAPSERLRQMAAALQSECRAAELQHQIAASLEDGDEHGLDEALVELERLGYDAHSLVFQARRAARRGDELAELRVLHRLATKWTNDDPPVMACFPQRYLDLLVQYGQMGLAADVLNRLEQTHPDLSRTLHVERLREALDAMQAGRMVLHVFVEGPERIHRARHAAQILGSPSQGLWELHRSTPVLLPDIALHPEQLAQALRDSSETGTEQLVETVSQPVLWFDPEHVEEDVCVLLPVFNDDRSDWAKLALRLAIRPAGTTLTRSILLDPMTKEHPCLGGPIVDLVGQFQDESARRIFVGPIDQRILTVLRRMRSGAQAAALDPLGGGG